MRLTAQFSDGIRKQLDGMAIGEQFTFTAHARIIGAEEALIDVTPYGAGETQYMSGELEVKLLISRAEVD